MTQELIYFMGPSGSGKNSVMNWLREHRPQGVSVRIARRVVTRESTDPNEVDMVVSQETFQEYVFREQLAMNWSAHGLHYGIKKSELMVSHDRELLLINGSRAYYAIAKAMFPDLIGVHITAQLETLKKRLLQRKRESPEAIEKRLRRATQVHPDGHMGWLEFNNDGEIERCAQEVWQELEKINQ